MDDFLYDGTFQGFLTCVYHHYYSGGAGGIYPQEDYQPQFLSGSRIISSDERLAGIVYRAIGEKISAFDLGRIYKGFLSGVPGREAHLLAYLVLGFGKGPSISRMHGNDTVLAVQKLEQQVNTEIHRFKGLIRFTVLPGNILYSAFQPRHDILEFLGPHFSDRFFRDRFVIHDVSRDRALFSSAGDWYIASFSGKDVPKAQGEEKEYQRLWQNYFRSIAIKERTNPRCQRQFMPVRYWKHLTEMAPEFPEP